MKPVRQHFLLFFLLLLSLNGWSQEAPLRPDTTFRNAVYLELGGNGIAYSLNYERCLLPLRQNAPRAIQLALRFGLNYIPNGPRLSFASILPIEFLLLIGQKRSRFETGPGAGPVFERIAINPNAPPTYLWYPLPTYRMGYRFTSHRGFVLRAAFIGYLIDWYGIREPKIWPAISLGKAF